MRHAVLALTLVALTSLPTAAQGNWAEKMFKEGIKHDFGNVPHGAQLMHRFPITNIYAKELDVIEVRSGCVCGSASPSTKTLEAAKAGFIEVLMDARKFTGPKTITIYVTVGKGSEYRSTAELKVSANSRQDVVFNPGEVDFGAVPQGQAAKRVIDVEYAGKLDWKVTNFSNNGAPLELELKELYRRPGQVGYRLEVALKPDTAPGAYKWEVQLETNDPASQKVPVLVEANVQAALTVTPGSLSFKDVKAGEERSLLLRIKGNKAFTVKALDGLGDGLTAELPSGSSPVHSIKFRFQSTTVGPFKKQVQIKTDLQEAPVTVTVEGNVVQ
jgi:hypothetical protein